MEKVCDTCAFSANGGCWHPSFQTVVSPDFPGDMPYLVRLTGLDCLGWLEGESKHEQ